MKKVILLICIIICSFSCVSCKKKIYTQDDLWAEIYSKNRDNSLIIRSIENGFDINTRDKRRKTLLHDACITNNYELAKYLVEHGLDTNAKSDNNSYPIHYAHTLEMVELLVEHGAVINVQRDDTGQTLLHIEPSVETVQYLLAHGADPNIKNSEGQTPFDAAMWNQQYDKAKILRPLTKKPMPAWLKEYNKRF
jgi:ankyrin repeat protein